MPGRSRQHTILHASLALAFLTSAAFAFVSLEPLIDHAWIGLLRHGGPLLRIRAAAALGARRSQRAVQHLVRALRQDADERVRDAAAEALGSLGPGAGGQAIEALIEAVAARALGALL